MSKQKLAPKPYESAPTRATRISRVRTPMLKTALLVSTLFALGGCQHLGLKKTPTNSTINSSRGETLAESSLKNNVVRGPQTISQAELNAQAARDNSINLTQTPSSLGVIPSLTSEAARISSTGGTAPRTKVKRIDAFVAPLPVPKFIDVVFGDMLKVPYITGPDVAKMTDIVQLRSSGQMRAADFQGLVTKALEEYGVRIVAEDGAYKALQDSVLQSRIPQFIKSRARPRTREDLRPIIQFVEMRALNPQSVMSFLTDAFSGQRGKLKVTASPQYNYVTLQGLPDSVAAAVDIINQLDELDFAGTQVQRFTPKYWNSKDLASTLARALRTEGWQVSTTENQVGTISLMSVDYSNDVFAFSKTDEARDRVASWVREFDRPVKGGDSEEIFVYQAQNVDAQVLADTVNAVLSGGGASLFAPVSTPGSQGAQSGGISLGRLGAASTAFSVDVPGNRLIYTGTTNAYSKVISLLEQLDTPAPEVLIEVQIAEVTLKDDTSTGVDFFMDDIGGSEFGATVQTGGLGRGSNGVVVQFLSGNIDATLNAFASNRRVKVLSTPTLTARSGGSAEIQVGQDVPIITSQRAADNQTGTGATDILQQIEYRETGVLMSIEPIVFSNNRIDLTISQEVSSAVSTANSTIASPTISNRSISTQLSLEDGQTAVLGGLIQENVIVDEQGVPILKDIPILGQVFSVDGYTVERTELVVLITAYVLRGQADRAQFVNYMSRRIDDMIEDESRLVTLLPKNF